MIARTRLTTLLALAGATASSVGAQGTPKEHRLPATPATVAYGYYWAEAKPVLRILCQMHRQWPVGAEQPEKVTPKPGRPTALLVVRDVNRKFDVVVPPARGGRGN